MTDTLGLDGHRAACERLQGRATAGSRRASRCGWPSARPTVPCAGGTGEAGLDVSGLDGVLSVDPERRIAQVLGMTTYERLVDATLSVGPMPLVVPQLRTITLGGAVTGLGIEASSFRNGLPHESVLEMDVLTGAGDVWWHASPTTSTRTCSAGSPTPTARSATRCGWGSSSSRCAVRAAAARPGPRPRRAGAARRRGARPGPRRRAGGLRRRHGVLGRRSRT